MRIAVINEAGAEERRVASTPEAVQNLLADGHQVFVQTGAGQNAGFYDDQYQEAGATVTPDLTSTLGDQGVVLTVGDLAGQDLTALTSDHLVIGLFDPVWDARPAQAVAATGAAVLSLDLVPRSTRAQAVDVLSSTATVVGFQAVLMAAERYPKLFPLLITAAGTIPPAKIVVLGAGVAGLQAMAIARRLGATVEGFDIRPEALEQIRSLGARSIEIEGPEGQETPEEQNARNQAGLIPYLAAADIVFTAAAIPGVRSPILVTETMVDAMKPGSLLVDLSAQRGGNCVYTQANEETLHGDVTILGPTNLASDMALSASRMFANNMVNLVRMLSNEGSLTIDRKDDVIEPMLVAIGGEIVHERVQQNLASATNPEVAS
ncbi:MAG: NAD(P)(+) transhydrogenase (Re/Si-specific) subunit alpha [Actinobacteria bacterium]|nr:NAD(P)(+) transhydrogenase (Re/Si-specific) subunit alpha [Actinomycetota bacterium]MBT4008988.1 NAD(P)(+) transhydrogenase (Re/Si-specific) subunit alpha [Actinomycetota bacterium]MBT4657110.1 NAD(P)(+) transhydrogenase (Re/Si-specific) subunit alpha [Actinomycetota bacterium]